MMDGPGCSATERWAAGRRSRWREVACRSDPPDLVIPWRQWRLARNSVCPLSSFPVLRCSEVRAGSLRDHGGRRLYGDERVACSVQSLAPYSVLLSASKRSRGCDTAAELCRVVGRWPWMSSRVPTSVLARDTRGRKAGRRMPRLLPEVQCAPSVRWPVPGAFRAFQVVLALGLS